MPELPEVETIRRGLEKHLIGYQIVDVEIRLPKMLQGDITNILGSTITKIDRLGKGLVIALDNGYALAIHIKMTGQLIFQDADIQKAFHPSIKAGGVLPHKHTHLIFKLERKTYNSKVDKAILFYNDIRQFGWMKIIKISDLKTLSFFRELGAEPLKDLTLEMFSAIVHSSKISIKPLLMDQKKIAGVGNIYANDALWKARINSTRKADTLTKHEIKELFAAIEFVLQKSLDYGGASEVNFVNALGEEGGYQHHFLVYNQKGKPCQRCGTKIEKIVVGGRGTFYCPVCQK